MVMNKVLGERGSNKYRKETTIECGTCGKTFEPEKILRYTMGTNDISLICPACHDKWVKTYEIKNIRFDDYLTPFKKVWVQYADEDESVLTAGPGTLRDDYLRVELPDETRDKFYKLEDAYRKDLISKQIDKFEILDAFDQQEIHCTTRGGLKVIIPFKIARDGKTLLDTSVEIPDFLMPQIIERLGS